MLQRQNAIVPRLKIALQDPYIVLNTILVLAYLPARFVLNSAPVTKPVYMGNGYEAYALLFLTILGSYIYRTNYYFDDFLASFIPFIRIVILFLLYQMHPRVMGWFLIASVCFALLAKRKLYSGPSNVASISFKEFTEHISEDDCSDILHMILFTSPNLKKSNRFFREYIELSLEYSCDETKFYSADVSVHSEFLDEFAIKFNRVSSELPVVVGIYRGEYYKVGRLPPLPLSQNLPDDIPANTFKNRDRSLEEPLWRSISTAIFSPAPSFSIRSVIKGFDLAERYTKALRREKHLRQLEEQLTLAQSQHSIPRSVSSSTGEPAIELNKQNSSANPALRKRKNPASNGKFGFNSSSNLEVKDSNEEPMVVHESVLPVTSEFNSRVMFPSPSS